MPLSALVFFSVFLFFARGSSVTVNLYDTYMLVHIIYLFHLQGQLLELEPERVEQGLRQPHSEPRYHLRLKK